MNSVTVKDLARLVVKAYIHFGVERSKVNLLQMLEDPYAAQKIVAASFGVLNEKSVVNIEQINQRGREIACENNGPLYKAWCGIKNAIENDQIYEDFPFEPAKSISKEIILDEYLRIGGMCRPGVSNRQLVQEFREITSGISGNKFTEDDFFEMQERAKKADNAITVRDLLHRVAVLHFATDMPETAVTIDVEAEVTEEKKERLVLGMREQKEQNEPKEQKKQRKRPPLLTSEEFQKKIGEVYGSGVVILASKYLGVDKPVHVRCPKCGKEWVRRASNLLTHPYECPYCAARKDVKDGTMSNKYRTVPEYKEEYFRAFLEEHGKGKYTFEPVDSSARFTSYDDVIITYVPTGATFKMKPATAMHILQKKEGELGGSSDNIAETNNAGKGEEKAMEMILDVETDKDSENSVEAEHTIGLFELQKYYNEAYAKFVGPQLVTGWKSMTNSMREVMPEKYPYDKVSRSGKHINAPVSLDDIEWISYYYDDMAKTPTADQAALSRAIRNSKVWGKILKDLRDLFNISDSEKADEKVEVQRKAMKSGTDKPRILTVEEQEEAKRKRKQYEKEFKPLFAAVDDILKEIGDSPFSLTMTSVFSLLMAAKQEHSIPDEAKALIANILEVDLDNGDSVNAEKLSKELECAKQEASECQARMKEMQKELDNAQSSLKSVREVLASA